MSRAPQSYRYSVGQLVWSPADPSLGIGVVTGIEETAIRVRFLRLQGDRHYTTRSAESAILRYEIGQGERVLDADGVERRVIKRHHVGADGLIVYELDDGRKVVESELAPEIRDVGPKERLSNLNLVHPEVLRARLEGIELERVGLRRGHAAVLGARVAWLPHQIDVARRALERDPVRMLLADEVGLGKTVEATLIYAGMREEGRAGRVLVLTPESLCIQWLGELYRKAHELFVLVDEHRMEDALTDHPDGNPFEAYQRVIVSLDQAVAREGWATLLAAAPWDLVVVDEAHHLRWNPKSGGNPAYRLVEALAGRARHLLLLTATPMALDPAEYHALLRLLEPSRFDDPRDFKRITTRVAQVRRAAVKLQTVVEKKRALAKRDADVVREILSDDREDQRLFTRWLKLPPGDERRRTQLDALLAMLRERHGLADFVVRNRRGPVGGLPKRISRTFPLEPRQEQGVLVEVGEGVMLDLVRTIDEAPTRRRMLGEMLRALWATPRALVDILRPVSAELARELEPYIARVVSAPLDREGLPTGDVRLRWLVETLRSRRRGEKILVFVESAIAVRALKDALEGVLGGDIAVFHRDLAPRDQDRQVAWFRDPEGPQIMLSTEAGGEGRNFQFCHVVVLYDLPWRPATIEQRIGRVDRVGQADDVEVLVPHFRSGYEAAVLKVMQSSIGVLDRTVGGIDHALEYVSDKLADLILEGAGVEAWKKLYLETEKMVREARERIEAGVDPILDHASFSPEGAAAILERVPADLEQRMETFVLRFAEHSRVSVRSKGSGLYAVEGAPGASGREDESGYVATFTRTFALDHEDVEFLSFGHPLVEQALEWATTAHDASASLALCRGFEADGAVFLWVYELDLPDDVPEARAYFDLPLVSLAFDEAGQRIPKLDRLLVDATRRLERMDAGPLRSNLRRWRELVDHNHEAADRIARQVVRKAARRAEELMRERYARRRRDRERALRREVAVLGRTTRGAREARARAGADIERLEREADRIATAIQNATARLVVVSAVRLLRATEVSV